MIERFPNFIAVSPGQKIEFVDDVYYGRFPNARIIGKRKIVGTLFLASHPTHCTNGQYRMIVESCEGPLSYCVGQSIQRPADRFFRYPIKIIELQKL